MKQLLKSHRFIELLYLILFVLLFSINIEAKETTEVMSKNEQALKMNQNNLFSITYPQNTTA